MNPFCSKEGHFNRAILDSLSAHIAVIDKDGKIVAVNEAWEYFAQGSTVSKNNKFHQPESDKII